MKDTPEQQFDIALAAITRTTCDIAKSDLELLQNFLNNAKASASNGDIQTVCNFLEQIAWRASTWSKDWR